MGEIFQVQPLILIKKGGVIGEPLVPLKKKNVKKK
jgi:hypothetical protein